MGCDGGTIPKRDELVKVKKRPEQKDKVAELSFQWRCCEISQEVLQSPIVACQLGRLYNKSAVIEGLLNRTLLPLNAKHIRSLKDIKDLNLTGNPEYKANEEKTGGMIDTRAAPFICPVTGLEMSGQFRFICIWSCGCVMSERAVKEITTKNCHKCQQPYTESDVIVLNGNENDIENMKIAMEERQALQKAKKKLKKNTAVGSSKIETPDSNSKPISCTESTSISLPSNEPSSSNFQSLGAPKSEPSSSNLQSLGAPKSEPSTNKRPNDDSKNLLVDPEIKKIKTDYSVAKDPKVTDVYKSLFTSHKSEQDQTRAHWVTYNPFYN